MDASDEISAGTTPLTRGHSEVSPLGQAETS